MNDTMKSVKLFSVWILVVSFLFSLCPDCAFSIGEERVVSKIGGVSEELLLPSPAQSNPTGAEMESRSGTRFLVPELTVDDFYSDILVCSSGEYRGWTVVCGSIAGDLQADLSGIERINLPFASPLLIGATTEWYFNGLPVSDLQNAREHPQVGLRYQVVLKNGEAYSFFLIRSVSNEEAKLYRLPQVEERKFKNHCHPTTPFRPLSTRPSRRHDCYPSEYYCAAGVTFWAGLTAGVVCGTCGCAFIPDVPLRMALTVGVRTFGGVGTVGALGIASCGLAKQYVPEAVMALEEDAYERCDRCGCCWSCCQEPAPAAPEASKSIERVIPPFLVNSVAVGNAKD